MYSVRRVTSAVRGRVCGVRESQHYKECHKVFSARRVTSAV